MGKSSITHLTTVRPLPLASPSPLIYNHVPGSQSKIQNLKLQKILLSLMINANVSSSFVTLHKVLKFVHTLSF